jgi:peptidoglycan/xylan/chitin deacetylase (PgdA/CDA1 family)
MDREDPGRSEQHALYSERQLSDRRRARSRGLRQRRRALLLGGLAAVALIALAVVLATHGSGSPMRARSASAGSPASRAPTGGQAGTHGATGGGDRTSGARTGKPGTQAVPILMYHVINPPPSGAPFPGLYVSPSEFAAQMQALHAAGFHAVTLDQVEAYWRDGAALPPGRPIVLSFDNGYQSQYTKAFPVLRGLGWVGVENIQLSGLPPSQGGMSEAQVRGLIAAGWELDTQGYNHAELTALPPAALHFQVTVARETLKRRFGVPVNWFCYPSGHYNAAVLAEVKSAGFIGSTTVVPGWAAPSSDPYRLPRLRVLGGTEPQELLSQIEAAEHNPPPPPSYT